MTLAMHMDDSGHAYGCDHVYDRRWFTLFLVIFSVSTFRLYSCGSRLSAAVTCDFSIDDYCRLSLIFAYLHANHRRRLTWCSTSSCLTSRQRFSATLRIGPRRRCWTRCSRGCTRLGGDGDILSPGDDATRYVDVGKL